MHLLKLFISVTCLCSLVLTLLPDDLKQLNDKLVEVSASKLALQMKVDELEGVQVNIKVSYNLLINQIFHKSSICIYIERYLFLEVN